MLCRQEGIRVGLLNATVYLLSRYYLIKNPMMLIWKMRFYFKKIFVNASLTLHFIPWELSFS